MNTLIIQDLARTEELDRSAMTAVRGGMKVGAPSNPFSSLIFSPSSNSSFHATQDLAQEQNVLNATANGSAFIDGLHVKNNTSQFGQNNIIAGPAQLI